MTRHTRKPGAEGRGGRSIPASYPWLVERRNWCRVRRAAPVVCIAALSLLAPSTAGATRVWLGRTTYRLTAQGSNGYSLQLSTFENRLYHRISLTAENEERQYVRYSVHGEPRNGKIHAIFPGVGKINVLMHPTRLNERPPPKGCKLPKAVIQYGTFVGTIKLRGEEWDTHC